VAVSVVVVEVDGNTTNVIELAVNVAPVAPPVGVSASTYVPGVFGRIETVPRACVPAAWLFPGVDVTVLVAFAKVQPVGFEPLVMLASLAVVVAVPAAATASVEAAGFEVIVKVKVITSSEPVDDAAPVVVTEITGDVSVVPTVPVVAAGVLTETAVIAAAALAGATETRPKPNADTATSAMRLRSVFVDICFLSLVDPRTIRSSAWEISAFSYVMRGYFSPDR
jgi:hypothetical protein